jgi:carboxyl-terminal processing protease
MKKLLKTLLISAIISISLFNTTAVAYDDVPHTSPYFYAIEYLRRNDVFKETRFFRPDVLISKAEFIKYLVLLNNPDFRTGKSVTLPFADTNDTSWYAQYLHEAIVLGILSGNEGTIYPYNRITVLEALELLFHSRQIPIPRRYVGPIPYTDLERNTRAQPLVMRSIELGVVDPERPDYFGLYKRLSRAEAAHMIYKMDLVDLRESGSGSAALPSYDPELQKIIQSWEIINSNYVHRDSINTSDLADNTISSMVESLEDPYSTFMNETENQAFADEFDGQIEGIGAFIAIDDDGKITVISPIKDSPAERAGIKAGDVILKVDDFDTEGANLYETVNRIKGPKGTTVSLTLGRNGGTVVIEVVRDVINIFSLESEKVSNGNIMHIKLLNFNSNAVQDFKELANTITNDSGIKGLILDMRNNPGGLLDVAIGILGFFLPDNSTAVQIRYSYFNFSQYTVGNGQLKDYPIVVLVNKGSASASEIVAGALKEYDVAKLIGETTFGKGTVQEVNYFSDYSSIKLTVAEWLTPEGNSIESAGITPHIEVIDEVDDSSDLQLNRAISELNRMF